MYFKLWKDIALFNSLRICSHENNASKLYLGALPSTPPDHSQQLPLLLHWYYRFQCFDKQQKTISVFKNLLSCCCGNSEGL